MAKTKKAPGKAAVKKAAKKKSIKKAAKKFVATIYCNSVTSDATNYYYFNGREGVPGYECGSTQRTVPKSKVLPPEQIGTCTDGKPLFKITFK